VSKQKDVNTVPTSLSPHMYNPESHVVVGGKERVHSTVEELELHHALINILGLHLSLPNKNITKESNLE